MMKKTFLFLLVFLAFTFLIIGAFSAKAQLAQTQPQAGISNPFYAITVNDLVSLLSTSSTATFFIQPIMNIVSENSASYFLDMRSFSTTTSGIVPKSNATYSTTEYLRGDGTWTTPMPYELDDGTLYSGGSYTYITYASVPLTISLPTYTVTAGEVLNVYLSSKMTYSYTDSKKCSADIYVNGGTASILYDNGLAIFHYITGRLVTDDPTYFANGDYDVFITSPGTIQFNIDLSCSTMGTNPWGQWGWQAEIYGKP